MPSGSFFNAQDFSGFFHEGRTPVSIYKSPDVSDRKERPYCTVPGELIAVSCHGWHVIGANGAFEVVVIENFHHFRHVNLPVIDERFMEVFPISPDVTEMNKGDGIPFTKVFERGRQILLFPLLSHFPKSTIPGQGI